MYLIDILSPFVFNVVGIYALNCKTVVSYFGVDNFYFQSRCGCSFNGNIFIKNHFACVNEFIPSVNFGIDIELPYGRGFFIDENRVKGLGLFETELYIVPLSALESPHGSLHGVNLFAVYKNCFGGGYNIGYPVCSAGGKDGQHKYNANYGINQFFHF